MVYNKKVNDKVIKTIATGNTYYRGDGTESTYAETSLLIDGWKVLGITIGNENYRDGIKEVNIDRQFFEKLGFTVNIN